MVMQSSRTPREGDAQRTNCPLRSQRVSDPEEGRYARPHPCPACPSSCQACLVGHVQTFYRMIDRRTPPLPTSASRRETGAGASMALREPQTRDLALPPCARRLPREAALCASPPCRARQPDVRPVTSSQQWTTGRAPGRERR